MAALVLAKAGVPCTVFERTRDPAAKVCGEFLSPEAVATLTAHGFPWQRLGPVTLDHVRLHNGRKNTVAPLPFRPAARSVPRPVLDEWLLGEAERHGAEVRRGTQVHGIEAREGRFHIEFEHARDGKAGVAFDDLILATGKHGLRQFHRRNPPKGQSLVGYKMNFKGLSHGLRAALNSTLDLFFFAGGYGGIARVADDELTISLLVQGHVLRSHGSRDTALLAALASRAPVVAQVLQECVPAWPRPLTVANLPYGHIDSPTCATAGLFAVGDQFAVLPSFTGTGLAFALTSGRLAAERLLADDREHAAAAYAQQAHATARAVMRRAMWLHGWFQRPLFARAAVAAAALMPRLSGAVARATRLPVRPALAPVGFTGREEPLE